MEQAEPKADTIYDPQQNNFRAATSRRKAKSSSKFELPTNYQQNHKYLLFQYVCHMKENIKYSPKKMWYIASFIRGLSIDEALKQLSFVLKKGAGDIKQTILEAQEMAVKRHNVEFKSNLWIGKTRESATKK